MDLGLSSGTCGARPLVIMAGMRDSDATKSSHQAIHPSPWSLQVTSIMLASLHSAKCRTFQFTMLPVHTRMHSISLWFYGSNYCFGLVMLHYYFSAFKFSAPAVNTAVACSMLLSC